MRLATFVHISDLHFGDLDVNGNGIPDARLPGIVQAIPVVFDGHLGHHYRALDRLEKFLHELRSVVPDVAVVVTGDLTSVGKPEQFDLALGYLEGYLDFPGWRSVGLRLHEYERGGDWRERGISGNHDQWPGEFWPHVRREPTAAFESCFPHRSRPFVGPSLSLPSGRHTLRFIGIDTDYDISPRGCRRLLAWGSFANQLRELDIGNQLQHPKPADEIRVLLLHHSPAHAGSTLRIDSESQAALRQFVERHRISVLLSGHIHTDHVGPLSPSMTGAQVLERPIEARCGTTTVRDYVPHGLLDHTVQFQPAPNRLFVHELELEQEEVWWIVYGYRLGKNGDGVEGFHREVRFDGVKVWPDNSHYSPL